MLYDVVLRGMRTSSICYFKAPVNRFYVLQHIATRAANHVEHIVHDNIALKCCSRLASSYKMSLDMSYQCCNMLR